MAITIRINTDNAAFEDPEELSRILRKLSDTVYGLTGDNVWDGIALYDVNGNKVGKVMKD